MAEYNEGTIVTGKVTGIQPYGAFVALEDSDKQGLVHISEVAHGFVKDINSHLSVGDEVKVKVLSVEENGKISLSIRATEEAPKAEPKRAPKQRAQKPQQQAPAEGGFNTLKDKLEDWIKQSKDRDSFLKK